MIEETTQEESPNKKCYNQALRILTRQDYSEYKLTQKLKEKGFEKSVISSVIQDLIEKNYLREDLYIEGRVKGFLRKGYSYQVIQYKLSQEMCTASLEEIENLAFEIGYQERDQLRELVEKKVRIDYDFLKSKDDKQKFKERVMRYAANRGHSPGKAAGYFDEIYENIQQNEHTPPY